MTAKRSVRLPNVAAAADLRRRRIAFALSSLAVAATGVVSLYQLGLLRHLPDPPVRGFDADRVHRSPQAYPVLGLPDGPLAVASFAVTAALAAADGGLGDRVGRERGDRDRRPRWLPVALAAKATADAAAAARLTWDEAFEIRAWSAFSLVTAAAAFATLPLVLPEAWRAIRTRRRPEGPRPAARA